MHLLIGIKTSLYPSNSNLLSLPSLLYNGRMPDVLHEFLDHFSAFLAKEFVLIEIPVTKRRELRNDSFLLLFIINKPGILCLPH